MLICMIKKNYLLVPSKFGGLSAALFPAEKMASLIMFKAVEPKGMGFECTNHTIFSSQGGAVRDPMYL